MEGFSHLSGSDISLPRLIATISDLLIVRKQVDFLLSRFQENDGVHKEDKEEDYCDHRAIGNNGDYGTSSLREKNMENHRSRISKRRDRNSCEVNRQINSTN